jgi:hypothetical protein
VRDISLLSKLFKGRLVFSDEVIHLRYKFFINTPGIFFLSDRLDDDLRGRFIEADVDFRTDSQLKLSEEFSGDRNTLAVADGTYFPVHEHLLYDVITAF